MHAHGSAEEVGRRFLRQVDPVRAAEVNGFLCKHRAAMVDNDLWRDIAKVSCAAAFIEVIYAYSPEIKNVTLFIPASSPSK